MNIELLEKIKKEKALKPDGTLNTVKILWLNKGKNESLLKEIKEYTSFLNVYDNVPLGFRILAIALDVTKVKYCICGKPCKLSIKDHIFYSSSCGNKECANKAKSDAHNNMSAERREYHKKNKQTKNNKILNDLKSKFVNNEYTVKNLDEVKLFISKKIDHNYNKLIYAYDLLKNCNELLSIIKFTSYINIDFSSIGHMKFAQRFYHIINNIPDIPKCNICKINNVRFSNYIQGYTVKVCKKCLPKYASLHRSENRLNKLQPLFYKNNCEILINNDENFTTYNRQVLIKDNRCGHIFKRWLSNGRMDKIDFNTICNICNPIHIEESGKELELFNFIKSLKFTTFEKANRDIIYPLELDIVIPSKKIAIEFNGNYWHSEEAGKNKIYHLNKTNKCLERGYRLIHIFEDEWINKQQIVKARLKNILGLTKRSIYARKCKIKEISGHDKDIFLEKYHIQGIDKSTIKLGLFYKNRLVAVMTFGKRRFDNKEGFELIRYCTVAHFNIVGGAGKLLAYFRKLHPGQVIISYADKRWSTGNLYKQLGFSLISESAPNYWYLEKDNKLIRLSRQQCMKHMLKDKLERFDENSTEVENMQNNGYTRIWDCGNYVFELK